MTARELTDGRADTGGWGSSTSRMGSSIQATFVRPVYVTSVTVAGGFIPSWGTDTKEGFGSMDTTLMMEIPMKNHGTMYELQRFFHW